MYLIELHDIDQNEGQRDVEDSPFDSIASKKSLLLASLAILVTFAVAVYLNRPPPSLSAYNEDE
jgi:hypothetical protein